MAEDTSNYDLCFKHRGKYIDICLDYMGTWTVRYGEGDDRLIGIGHDKAGTGFPTREDAFNWAKGEIGFSQSYDEVCNFDD